MQCVCDQCKSSMTEQQKNTHIDTYENQLEQNWVAHYAPKPGDDNEAFRDQLNVIMKLLPTLKPETMGKKLWLPVQNLREILEPGPCSKFRVQDFQYLKQECQPFLDSCVLAFEQRHTDTVWWNCVAVLFRALMAYLSPKQALWLLDDQWLHRLVVSLADLPVVTGCPDQTTVVHSTFITLSTLFLAVESNFKFGKKLQSLGVSKAILSIAPKIGGFQHLSRAMASWLTEYMNSLLEVGSTLEAQDFETAAAILRMNYSDHSEALQILMPIMMDLVSFSKHQSSLQEILLPAMTDFLENLANPIKSKWKPRLAEILLDFTKAVMSGAACGCMYNNPHFWRLLQHPNWGLLSQTLLLHLENGSDSKAKKEISEFVGNISQMVMQSDLLRSKASVPIKTVQLAIHLTKTETNGHFADHFLPLYYAYAPLEDLHTLVENYTAMLAKYTKNSDSNMSESSLKALNRLKEALKIRQKPDYVKIFTKMAESTTCSLRLAPKPHQQAQKAQKSKH